MCQLQGRMMIHGRKWVDIFSYHPALSIPPLRVVRDEKFIVDLSEIMKAFVDTMLDARLKLEQRFGPFKQSEDEKFYGQDYLTQEDVDEYLASRGVPKV